MRGGAESLSHMVKDVWDLTLNDLIKARYNQPWRAQGMGWQSGMFDFCRDLEALSFPDFALKRKCTLSERSEFGHFRFAFSKIWKG